MRVRKGSERSKGPFYFIPISVPFFLFHFQILMVASIQDIYVLCVEYGLKASDHDLSLFHMEWRYRQASKHAIHNLNYYGKIIP